MFCALTNHNAGRVLSILKCLNKTVIPIYNKDMHVTGYHDYNDVFEDTIKRLHF